MFKGYKFAEQDKAESEIVCLLLKGFQADKIKEVKNRLLDETNLSFETVCAKLSSAAQCECPVKSKGVLVIIFLESSGEIPSKTEKRKARIKEGNIRWKNPIGSDGKPVLSLLKLDNGTQKQ